MTDNPVSTPSVVDLANQLKAQLLRRDAQAMARIARAYTAMYDRLIPYIESLARIIAEEGLTPARAARLAQYSRLMNAINRESAAYNGYLRTELSQIARDAIRQATRDARIITNAGLNAIGVTGASFGALDPRVVERLIGFLNPEGPLYQRLDVVFGGLADRVAETITSGVGLGQGPRETARQVVQIQGLIRNALGNALTDALRNTRTVQLWSYREATRANYLANSDIVKGWVWMAALDDRTCELCLAEDGKVHDTSEFMEAHYNCRCTLVPWFGEGYPAAREQTGADWFAGLSEDRQREILGPGKFELYQNGTPLSAFVTREQNEIYGSMIASVPLRDLEGE